MAKNPKLPVFSERKLTLQPGQVVKVSFDLGAAKEGFKLIGGLTCIGVDAEHAHIGNMRKKEATGVLHAWTGKPAKDQAPTLAKSKPMQSPFTLGKRRISFKEMTDKIKQIRPQQPPDDQEKETKKSTAKKGKK